jgi:hypothetical protein
VHQQAVGAISNLDRRATVPSDLDEFGGVQAKTGFLLQRPVTGKAALFQKRFDSLRIKPVGGGLCQDWNDCGFRRENKQSSEEKTARPMRRHPEAQGKSRRHRT